MLLHASCVCLNNKGVLLLGESGAGKSSAALALIEKGAVLVADDYVEVNVENNQVVARCPDTIFGKLEVRGVGIVSMNAIQSCSVDLVIQCVRDFGAVPRMPDNMLWQELEKKLPLYTLCPFENIFFTKVCLALENS